MYYDTHYTLQNKTYIFEEKLPKTFVALFWNFDGLLQQNSLVIDTPRVRKQTRPFSATKDELAELSEGESDSDETKPKLRRNYDRLNSYGRTECFRVEKNLLVYGWVSDNLVVLVRDSLKKKISNAAFPKSVHSRLPGGAVGKTFSNMAVLRSSWQSGM